MLALVTIQEHGNDYTSQWDGVSEVYLVTTQFTRYKNRLEGIT